MHAARQVDDLEGVRSAQRVLLPTQRVLAVKKRQRQCQCLLRAERHTHRRTARPRARRRWLGDALAFRRVSARVELASRLEQHVWRDLDGAAGESGSSTLRDRASDA